MGDLGNYQRDGRSPERLRLEIGPKLQQAIERETHENPFRRLDPDNVAILESSGGGQELRLRYGARDVIRKLMLVGLQQTTQS
jgi:hypothetical protein